ncbi:MAG: hypothetical protein JWM68_1391 [Verrucomicrobiales bacterium]|nr:hypothetical protein [Verrucomicrobiales bacterium]
MCLYLGCSRSLHNESPANRPGFKRADEITRWVVPGVNTNFVRGKLGEPSGIDQFSDGKERWNYVVEPTPATGDMAGTQIIGATLVFTNGQLERSGWIYLQ